MYRHLFLLTAILVSQVTFAEEKVTSWGGGLNNKPDPTLPWGNTRPEAPPAPPKKNEEQVVYNSEIRIGGNYTYAWMTPEGGNSFNGNMGGAQGIYEYRPNKGLYEALRGTYRQGRLSTHNDASERDLLDLRGEGRIGYTYLYNRFKTATTLFTGFGYRYLGQSVVGSASYYDYNELYVPVGFLVDRHLHKNYYGGVNFVWMPQVFSFVDVNPYSTTHYATSRQLCNFLVEVPFTYRSNNKRWLAELKPFIEFWKDGMSTSAALPENKYFFVGAELNFGLAF